MIPQRQWGTMQNNQMHSVTELSSMLLHACCYLYSDNSMAACTCHSEECDGLAPTVPIVLHPQHLIGNACYRAVQVIEDNKATLKVKYDAAKSAAAVVNETKSIIARLKAGIEQRRAQRHLARMASGGGGDGCDDSDDAEEQRMKSLIEQARCRLLWCDVGVCGGRGWRGM